MQYGNPYFAQPFQQIQPYQDRLAQLQNSYQQAMPYGQAQIQQPIQQMPQVPQIPMLQGQMVDGIDTVKAKDVDMSGNPVYYPKTDGTEVYRKQLQADGRSRIFTYRLVNEGEQPESNNTNQVDIVSLINQLRDDVHAEISEIKELLPIQSEPPKTQKGGNQRWMNANRKKSILDAWDMTVTAIQMGVSLQKVGEPEKVIDHICTWKMMTGWMSI